MRLFTACDDEVTKEVKDYMPPVYHSEFRDFKVDEDDYEDIPRMIRW